MGEHARQMRVHGAGLGRHFHGLARGLARRLAQAGAKQRIWPGGQTAPWVFGSIGMGPPTAGTSRW